MTSASVTLELFLCEGLEECLEDALVGTFEDDLTERFEDDAERFFEDDADECLDVFECLLANVDDSETLSDRDRAVLVPL